MRGPFLFYIKYCRNGHGLYALEEKPAATHCDRCGEAYIEKCTNCGESVPNVFHSRVYPSGNLLHPPGKPPSFCKACGKPLPWEEKKQQLPKDAGVWNLLHPRVVEVARPRFESGHYADSVEAALKAVNSNVKAIYKERTGKELDGSQLMKSCFSPNNPTVVLGCDLETETGKSMQLGYMEIFAGAMSGIRNPKAHDNIEIEPERAIHHLFLASLLFSKLDEAK